MFRTLRFISIFICILLLLSACDSLAPLLSSEQEIPVTGGEAQIMDDESPESESSPTSEPPAADTSTASPIPPTETPRVTPTPLPPPVHSEYPNGAIFYDAQRVKDCPSGGSRKEGVPIFVGTGCDMWLDNLLERPLDRTLIGYNPNLDIVQQEFGFYDGWYYARMLIYQDAFTITDLNHAYGIEIDLDIDNNGDLLIYAINPQSLGPTEWLAERVYVWQDLDDDVGGIIPVSADSLPFNGNGYEVKVYESGYGDDPDLAWARISPGANYAIEFAFKQDLIPNQNPFLWWMWAAEEVFFPGMFDYVDNMPASETYKLDNTCRWIFGAAPRELPNICPYYKAPPDRPPGQCFCPPPDPTGQQPPCTCP